MGKSLLIRGILAGFVAIAAASGILAPQTINADLKNSSVTLNPAMIMKNGHLTICKINGTSYQVIKKLKMVVTAYASVPDETDDTPFITASGHHVADGIIANNMLPFGTKVRMPELYGNKIFVVEDRMNARKGKLQADIWMPSVSQARIFGAKVTDIEVVES